MRRGGGGGESSFFEVVFFLFRRDRLASDRSPAQLARLFFHISVFQRTSSAAASAPLSAPGGRGPIVMLFRERVV